MSCKGDCMRILLAIDGSECSLLAVSEVARRPWPANTEVRVITVNVPWSEGISRRSSAGLLDELKRQLLEYAWQRLNEAVAVLRREAPALSVTPVLRDGLPKDVILDEAERWRADLIVVGSHGYGAVKRLFLGSVSLAIATHAPCSVEIVRVPPA